MKLYLKWESLQKHTVHEDNNILLTEPEDRPSSPKRATLPASRNSSLTSLALLLRYRDLNAVIANYLFTEGYSSAAENFTREANISPPIDLESIGSRMEIRRAVQSGDVEQATEMVNELNPEVSFPVCWRGSREGKEQATTTSRDYNVLCTTLRDKSWL